jgi:hypothetical protein
MKLPKELIKVTTLSKSLAITLFFTLPVVGFLLGIRHQQIISAPTIITNSPTPTPFPMPTIYPSEAPQPVKLARKDLAKQLDTAVSNIEIIKIEEKTWSDGSMGCPKEGFLYTQALIPGYKVTFKYKQKLYFYNTDKNSSFVQCDK